MDNINMTDAQLRKLIDGLADGLVRRIYGVANDIDDPRDNKYGNAIVKMMKLLAS
jgi:hypothetical protein